MKISTWYSLLLALTVAKTQAGGGPLGIDHEWRRDESGIWSRSVQKDLESGTIIFEIAGALWLGNDRQFGHTLFQSVDSSLIAGVAAQGMKLAFGRARPEQGNDPDQWFKGRCCSSFPSGEVTLQASFVTPIILQYHAEHPWIWSLETLPLYSSIARVKSQAHWQTDVLAGWALGTGVGYWASSFKTPFVVQMLPRGMTLGYHRQF